jgi:hypothetical protein
MPARRDRAARRPLAATLKPTKSPPVAPTTTRGARSRDVCRVSFDASRRACARKESINLDAAGRQSRATLDVKDPDDAVRRRVRAAARTRHTHTHTQTHTHCIHTHTHCRHTHCRHTRYTTTHTKTSWPAAGVYLYLYVYTHTYVCATSPVHPISSQHSTAQHRDIRTFGHSDTLRIDGRMDGLT